MNVRSAKMDWTTLEDVEWWINQVSSSTHGVEFDGPQFLRPFHFGILANHVLRSRATDVTVPTPLQGYAATMQLWQSVGIEPPRGVNPRYPGGRYHPLSRITSEATADAIADGILEIFRQTGTTDQRTLESIFITLSEIFQNCFFHAEAGTEICGLACAQSWPGRRLAQVAVTDIGIGVRESLNANSAYRARLLTENAASLATEYGVTSKPPPGRHSGYGLTLARHLMEQHGGNFLLLSHNEAFTATQQGPRAQELRSPWEGTIVVLEWRPGRPFDIGTVYKGWPKDGDDDEIF